MKCLLEQSRAPNSSAAAGLGSEGRRAESSKLVVLAILSELLVQEFKSDITAQAGVLGPVNHTHPSAAQFLQDFVVRNSLADHVVPLIFSVIFLNAKSVGAERQSKSPSILGGMGWSGFAAGTLRAQPLKPSAFAPLRNTYLNTYKVLEAKERQGRYLC